jgi:sugar phosphate isomerase/epimerase
VAITPEALVRRVQVNIPFPFLLAGYLPRFLKGGLNPEIGLDAGSLKRFSAATFRRIARTFQEAGRRLTLHGPFQDMAPGALDDGILAASRRRLRQFLGWLPVFRPVAVICHLGFEARHYQWDRENWLTRSAATWKELAALAAAHQTTLMLENVYETDPTLFLEVISRVNSPHLQVCLDVGHLLAFGGGDFTLWLKTLWPVIGQLHLHDNSGEDDTHQALGTGQVPLQYVLDFLAERGSQPLITLEPHQEGSLTPSLQYLSQIWPWE